jgi:CrcB protein
MDGKRNSLLIYLWIAIGSGLGGVARYGSTMLASWWLGPEFLWGTIAVNAIGSFVIGYFATITSGARYPMSIEARAFVMVGICGGYTTFSSFSLENFLLLRAGAWFAAGANVGVSMVLCLALVWLGHLLAVALDGRHVATTGPLRGR